jgi:nucleoside-diphosphate-sugar epimerase
LIKRCVFPAAGYGTRLLLATKATPKEMLSILTKPLIQYGAEEAVESGIKTMAIVTGRGKRAIEGHFDISIKELAETIKDIIGFQGEFYFNADKPGGMMKKLTDVSKLHELGWKHTIKLKSGIEKMYNWYKENNDN